MKPPEPAGQVIDVVFLTDEPDGRAAVRADLALIAARLATLLDRVAAATGGASVAELTQVRDGARELADAVGSAIVRVAQPPAVRAAVVSYPSVQPTDRVPAYRPLRANPACSRGA